MSDHYRTGKVPETWEIIEAWQETWDPDVRYHLGSAVKYLSRIGRKDGAPQVMDIIKARNFLNRAVHVLTERALEGAKGREG